MAGGTQSKSQSHKIDSKTEAEGYFITLDLVKELLKVQESTMKSFFIAIIESTNTKSDNIIKDVQDLKCSSWIFPNPR